MTFRARLASFLVASLAVLQLLTAVLIYEVTRSQIIHEGERQLMLAGATFSRQLNDVSERVANDVQVLTLDFALRSAIAQHDRDTVVSALRNHGRRIGATRMLLIGLDGNMEADTQPGAPGDTGVSIHFPFNDLFDSSLDGPAAAVVAWKGHAYWLVVVPVSAPALIGVIAAAIPIDDAFLAHLREESTLLRTIELATESDTGKWTVDARGSEDVSVAGRLIDAGKTWSGTPTLVDVDGREYLSLAARLHSSKQSRGIEAVLGYSLDDALRPYKSVVSTWLALLSLGLLIGLAGALLIARGVSRPVEKLAETARRIAAGDYRPAEPIAQRGELGDLDAALRAMTQAIGEREERIRFQSGHDAVTGLVNRVAATLAIQQQLDNGADLRGALLVIALTRMPEITKTMGHALGDRLMHDAGGRIRSRAGEALVARAGDEKFLVWLRAPEHADAVAIAFGLLDVLGEPYREADLAIDTAPAVGIALLPQHGANASELMQRAEVALLSALGSEDAVVVYDPATDPHRPERLSLMSELREALDQNRLTLNYQAKLNLATRTVDCAEGLVRWTHPKLGPMPPDSFIPLAEETGNIRRITRWVLAAGIAQVREWKASGHALRVALNLSARDLEDTDLPRRISELLAIHGVAPRDIVLELTESAVMARREQAMRTLAQLADRGIDVAIDDFGVGQSSLAYLRRLPVRELKIDKSFVQPLAEGQSDRAIVASIVELGHRFGYRVTAEGVSDQATLDYLAEIGCDHAQGYFIARPMPQEQLARFLSTGTWRSEKSLA